MFLIKSFRGAVSAIAAILFVASPMAARADLVSVAVPSSALEGTSGNFGFVTLKNTGTDVLFISNIKALTFVIISGESDDQAINLSLVAPSPTPNNLLQLAANGGTANIKFKWDAVDYVQDGDNDFGVWSAGFLVTIEGVNVPQLVEGQVIVTDIPEPSTWAMMLLGFAGLGFVAHRRWKRALAAS